MYPSLNTTMIELILLRKSIPLPPAPAERQVITDEDIYKVLDNRIVRRGRGTSTEYLIQLRGQQRKEARWYNEKELENAPSVFPDELGLIRIAPNVGNHPIKVT